MTMQKLRKDEESALAKILDAKQMKRVREIGLQMEGPFAILHNQELAQKLGVTEEQYAEIQDVEQQANEKGRAIGQQMRTVMEKVRASMPQPPQNENQDDNGRGRRGNFDREAFRKAMEDPEVKAATDKIGQQQAALRDQNFSRVFKALDRGQSSKYKQMLGDKFDTEGMIRGMFAGGPPGGPGGPAAPNAAPATPAAPANAPAAAAAAAPAPAAATAKPAAAAPKAASTPARGGSLRERRGLGSSSAQPQ